MFFQTPTDEIFEQHRRAGSPAHLVRPGLGFKSVVTPHGQIARYEVSAMIRKGQGVI
ncbi:hypothetical protein AB4Y97_00110 [Microvirga sp. 2TAF3]